jgi:hypothetical protein
VKFVGENNLRNVVVHYHIFKNAGSTFANALRRNFGRLYAEFEGTRSNAHLSGVDLINFLQAYPNILAVSSHHLRLPRPATTGSLLVHDVIFVRNPIDRIRSIYDFSRQAVPNGDPMTSVAKELDIRSFVRFLIDKHPNLVSNPQVNLIANGGARIPTPADLHRAIDRVRKACVIGVTEHFNMCAATAEHYLRDLFPGLDLSHAPENVTQGFRKSLPLRIEDFESCCAPHLFQEVLERNELDLALVEFATAEALARFNKLSEREVLLKDFQRRVGERMSETRDLSPIFRNPSRFLS